MRDLDRNITLKKNTKRLCFIYLTKLMKIPGKFQKLVESILSGRALVMRPLVQYYFCNTSQTQETPHRLFTFPGAATGRAGS